MSYIVICTTIAIVFYITDVLNLLSNMSTNCTYIAEMAKSNKNNNISNF